MSAVINLVTTVAMLIHAVVGCCAHHGHAACEERSHGEVACEQDAHDHSDAAPSEHAACDGHEHDAAELCLEHGHGSLCTDAKCVFVKTSLQTVSLAPVEAALDVAVDLTAVEATQHVLALRALPANPLKLRDSAVAVCAQLQVWAV